MEARLTKARLIEMLRAARAEWEAALRAVPEGRLCEPGAAGAWSVKDVVVQLAYLEQWYADRLDEALRGEPYAPCAMDALAGESLSEVLHRQHRHRPLADVLAEAHYSFRRLLRAVDAHSEAFLTQPRAFAGAPEAAPVWHGLRSEVCGRYERHGADLRAWLAG
jgi:hypothetical protein